MNINFLLQLPQNGVFSRQSFFWLLNPFIFLVCWNEENKRVFLFFILDFCKLFSLFLNILFFRLLYFIVGFNCFEFLEFLKMKSNFFSPSFPDIIGLIYFRTALIVGGPFQFDCFEVYLGIFYLQ